MKKRLFVATENDLLWSVASVKQFDQIGKVLNGFPKSGELGCYKNKDKCFGPCDNEESYSIFILTDSNTDTVLEMLKKMDINKNGIQDYLLYHLSKKQPKVMALFNPLCKLGGKHEKYDPKNSPEYNYYSFLVDVLLDDDVAGEQKAEEAIKRIWPSKERKKKEGVKLLESYRKKAPKGECPGLFADGDKMEKAFKKLKGKGNPGGVDYNAALVELMRAFVEWLNKTNFD